MKKIKPANEFCSKKWKTYDGSAITSGFLFPRWHERLACVLIFPPSFFSVGESLWFIKFYFVFQLITSTFSESNLRSNQLSSETLAARDQLSAARNPLPSCDYYPLFYHSLKEGLLTFFFFLFMTLVTLLLLLSNSPTVTLLLVLPSVFRWGVPWEMEIFRTSLFFHRLYVPWVWSNPDVFLLCRGFGEESWGIGRLMYLLCPMMACLRSFTSLTRSPGPLVN